MALLQALSNQKLLEMRERFGHMRCGLQTGDTSLNADADIVIMTTEILRNIMYRTAEVEDAVQVATAGGQVGPELWEQQWGQGQVGMVEWGAVFFFVFGERSCLDQRAETPGFSAQFESPNV